MKKILVALLIFMASSSFAKTFFEAQLIGESSNWGQEISGLVDEGDSNNDYSAAINSSNLGIALYAHYIWGQVLFSAEYAYLQSSVKYKEASNFSGDDNWSESSSANKTDFYLHVGYVFNLFALSLAYSPVSAVDFSDYYIDGIDSADFSGTGMKLQLTVPLSESIKFGVYYSQNTYDEANFDGTSIRFPDTFSSIDFSKLSLNNLGLSVGYIF